MKKIFLLNIMAMLLSFVSNGQDYPTIAKEYCNCFKTIKVIMDIENQELMIRVANDSNIKVAFKNEMSKLNAEKQMNLLSQLEKFGKAIESDDTDEGKCGLALDSKYKSYVDTPEKEKEHNTKLFAELKKVKGCELFGAIAIFTTVL